MLAICLLILVLLISAANLVLGYAAFAYLGIGPRNKEQLYKALAPRKVLIIASTRDVEPSTEPEPTPSATPEAETASTDDPTTRHCRELLDEISQFELQIAHLDDQLRQLKESPTKDTLELFAEKLSYETYQHLEQLNRSLEPLQRISANEEFVQQRAQAQGCVDLAVVEINNTLADLSKYRTLPVEDGVTVVATGTSQVRETCWRMRDLLEESVAKLLLDHLDLEKIDAQLRADRLSNLCNRLGWETSMRERHGDADACAAVFDLDRFAEVVDRYGISASDTLLETFAGKLRDLFDENAVLARVAGKRFFLFCPNLEVNAAAQVVEQLRQSLEHMRFMVGEAVFTTTTSAAVVAVVPQEPIEQVFERLEITVHEAKKYGRNRTFVCETDCPVPVNPPKLAVEERAVYL